MKLYGSPTSPFVRKARVLLKEKNIPFEFFPEDPWPADSPIIARNPLSKVPALDKGDGDYLFESIYVCQYIDQQGKPVTAAEVEGRVVLVEFWATWCPPCRSTLEWLSALQRQHGDRIAVLALAVESPED